MEWHLCSIDSIKFRERFDFSQKRPLLVSFPNDALKFIDSIEPDGVIHLPKQKCTVLFKLSQGVWNI